MKLRATVLGSLLVLLFAVTSAEALILDAPHNEDNGVYCYHCHSADPGTGEDKWYVPTNANVDDTTYNWVCLRCHDGSLAFPAPADQYLQGPTKPLHATSTTGSIKAEWSTECVACHDPHFQAQTDWIETDQGNIYVDEGTYDTTVTGGTLFYDSGDVYPPGVGGIMGTTVIGINVPAGWTVDPVSWSRKGQAPGYEASATDNSRGFLLVATSAAFGVGSRNFEIVEVTHVTGTQYLMKVNGNATAAGLSHGITFGVIYGASVRSQVIVSPTERRTVKFFGPDNIPGSYGGLVDKTAGSTSPVGICQVCHTGTGYFTNATEELTHHVNDGTECMDCHDHTKAYQGSADHTFFIADDAETGAPLNVCSGCHAGYAAGPENAHSACAVCHTSAPDLFDNTFASYDGQPDDDGASMFANLVTAGYQNVGVGIRIQDAEGDDITGAFTKIKCGSCHAAKPDALNLGEHGGHVSTDFAYDGTCIDCHDGGAAGIVDGIHSGNCIVCHDNAQGGLGTTIAGNGTNGIDGDATLGAALADYKLATCSTCHDVIAPNGAVTAVSIGGIHHANAVVATANGLLNDDVTCLTNCHAIAGYADHSATVVNVTGSCVNCHASTSGTAAGISVLSGNVRVHDNCGVCHFIDTDDMVKLNPTPSQPNALGVTAIAVGDCVTCHTAYALLDHNHAHTGVNPTVDNTCEDCHDAGVSTHQARDAITTPYTAGVEVHAALGCGACHDTISGAFKVGTNSGTGGVCSACHTATWQIIHTPAAVDHLTSKVTATSNGTCENCHDAAAGGTAPDALSSPFVGAGEAHNNTSGAYSGTCENCHTVAGDIATAPTLAPGLSTIGGNCAACHSNHFNGHTHGHGADVVADTNCTTSGCHDANSTGVARGTLASPYIGANDVHFAAGCATCHNTDGSYVNGGAGQGNATGGAGDCSSCHTGGWETLHTSVVLVNHTSKVAATTDSTCETCHTTTGSNAQIAINATVDRAGDLIHDACTSCHTAVGALDTAKNGVGIVLGTVATGNCNQCHTAAYFDSHIHGTTTGISHVVSYVAGTDISQVSSPAPCGTCHDGNNADTDGTPLNSWADILSEHETGCARCHSYTEPGGETPPTPSQLENDNAIGSRTSATCTTCHKQKLSPDVDSDHGGHPDTDFGWAGGCENCHGAGAAAEAVVSGIHAGTCDLCHTTGGPYNDGTEKVGVNGDGDATLANGAAVNVPAFDAGVYTCVTCHNQTQVAGFHGITTAEVTLSHQLSSDSTGGYDCEACHTTNVANEQLTTHLPADTVANCALVCHGNTTASTTSGIVAKTLIAAVTFDIGANTNDTKCEDCHVAKGDFKRHGLTDDAGLDGVANEHNNLSVSSNVGSGTETDCAACHNLTSSLTRLVMHTQPLSGDPNDCLTCHIAGGAAQTAIDAGKSSAALPAAQNCEDCHAAKGDYTRHGLTDDAGLDGVVDVHEQLSSQSGAATSTCSNCHSAADVISRLQLHTQAAVTPTTCLTCHQAAAPVSTVIAAGWTATPNAAQCDECHTAIGSDWTAHNVDHATARVTADTNCTSCHDTTAGANTTAPNSDASPFVGVTENHNPTGCYTCHNNVDVANRGTYLLVAAANVKGYVSAMPATGNCSGCHGSYFDLHVHGVDGGYIDHAVTHVVGTDTSQDGTAGNDCYNCHDDSSLGKGTGALGTWTAIKTEHETVAGGAQNACSICHDYATNGNLSGDASTPLLGDVTGAISAGTATCITCHQPKSFVDSSATSSHGGHSAAAFAWTGSCGAAACHDSATNTDIVTDIHSATCTMCHTTASGGAGTAKVGANGDANALLAAALPDFNTATCVTCHDFTDANVTAGSVGGIHHNLADAAFGSNCTTSCHSTATTGLVSNSHATRVATAAECTSCHSGTPGDATTVPTVPADGTIHDSCVDCHEITGPGYAAVRVTVAAGRGLPAGQIPANGGTCTTCHSTTPFKDFHHSGANAQGGNCILCHNQSLVGGTAPTQMGCKECHVDETQTGIKVMAYRLSQASGSDSSASLLKTDAAVTGIDASGYVSSHSIVGASAIAIADYAVCMDCHSRGNTTISTGLRAAPIIAPFHGFPGDASSGSLLTPGNNLTNIDGTQMQSDEADVNFTPLVFQWNHPGHNTFRRWGTATMTQRGVRNGTNNERLYDEGPLGGTNGGNDYRAMWDPGDACAAYTGGAVVCGGQGLGQTTQDFGIAWETPVTGYADRINIPYTNFGTISSGPTNYDGGYGSTANVPYFNVTVTPTLPDNVYVNSAEVDINGDLQISAGNTDGCAELSVHPDGGASIGNMSGTSPNCTFTSVGINPVPTTVDIQTTNVLGNNVVGYPVVDNSSNPGTLTLSAATYSVNENGTSVTITVNRTGGSGAVAVDYATSDGTATAGSDYTATTGTLNWADTDTAAKTFTISITNDGTTEADETVNITLSNNTGGTTLGVPSTAVLTIIDDDQPGTIALTSATYSVAEGGGSIIITATRTAGSVGVVGVSFATSDGTATAGSDYTANSGTLSWADADTADKTFTVSITQDVLAEGPETVNLAISAATGGAILGTPNTAVLTITDDDNTAPSISISAPGVGATGAPGSYNITYTLSDPDDVATVTFYYDQVGSGYGGTQTAGAACTAAPEGTNATCAWDTSGLADGTYYVYGVATDGVNPAVDSAYSGDLTLTTPSSTPIVLDASGGGYESDTTATANVAWSHTTGTGSNRYLLVGVSWDNRSGEPASVTSVSYGAQNLTFIGFVGGSVPKSRAELWGLANPTSGTATITVDCASTRGIIAASSSWTGVHQTTSYGILASATAASGEPSTTISAATGDMVVDIIGAYKGTSATATGTGQTALYTGGLSGERTGGMSYTPGAASVTMAWTTGHQGDYSHVLIPLKQANP